MSPSFLYERTESEPVRRRRVDYRSLTDTLKVCSIKATRLLTVLLCILEPKISKDFFSRAVNTRVIVFRELGKVRVQIGPVGFQQNKLSVYLEQFLKLRATRKWTLFRHSESYTIGTGLRSTDFVEKSISKWKFAQMFKKWIIPKKSTVSFIIIKNNQFNYLSDFKV